MKMKDHTGKRFGRLVAIRVDHIQKYPRGSRVYWLCKCDCGNEKVICANKLTTGWTQSCSCLHKEMMARSRFKHGHCPKGGNTPEFTAWVGMQNRCHNPKAVNRADYAERGIYVCDRWRGENGFVNFLDDVGLKPSPEHSLGRIDNDGPYSPENCRWEDRFQQARNTRRTHRLTHNGVTKTITEWSRDLGLSETGIHTRLKNGWTLERALSTPRTRLGLRQPRNETPTAGVNGTGAAISPRWWLAD